MGLPEINFEFQALAVSAIARSQRGVVALILKDDTSSYESIEYKSVTEVGNDDWTAANYDFISMAFLGANRVIVERVDEDVTNYSAALTRLATKRWNYIAIPAIAGADVTTVSSWIKEQRDDYLKPFKAVLPNSVADHEGIINFTTDDIVIGGKTYTTAEFTPRIAGILAGLSLERSATYFVLPEVDSITQSQTPDDDIDGGELILIHDGEKVKIGRGVNSLTTFTPTKSREWSKIKIVEGMDLVRTDIIKTWEDNYVGKVNNSYDNQVLFLASVNAYLSGLEGSVLNPNVENYAEVNVESQRQAWESIGTDTSVWDDQEVKNNSFQSKVFLTGKARFLDAMEDLDFAINV